MTNHNEEANENTNETLNETLNETPKETTNSLTNELTNQSTELSSINITIERDPKPFEGQQKAITTLDRNVIVSAGAGSGKTWVLTERYLEILSKGYRPSQVIAITFTEKAAGEMKGRIRAAVKQMALKSTNTTEKKYWEQCEQDLKYSMITTIHGFCSRLLKAHPIEAGLDPSFSVLDGTEGNLLLNDVFQQTVQRYLEEESEANQLLYEQFARIGDIASAARVLYSQMRTYHKTVSDLWEETNSQLSKQKEKMNEQLQKIDQLIAHIRMEVNSAKETAKKEPKYIADCENWLARYESARPFIEESEAQLTYELEQMIDDLLNNKWRKSGSDTLKEVTSELRDVALPELLKCFVAPHYSQVVQALLQVVQKADRAYTEAKQAQQVVDFADLELLTANLLANSPTVCQKWQQRVKFLMVDEFQDTNAVQKQIIDCFSNKGCNMRLFVVGDGKQSIYRFRGADVQVFYQMEDELLATGGEKISLAMNFRTQHGVIGYINGLFEQLMYKEERDPLYYTKYEALEAFRKLQKPNAEIEFIAIHEEQENEDDQGEADLRSQAIDGGTRNEKNEKNGKNEEIGLKERSEEEQEQHWVEKESDLLARRIKQMVEQNETLVWGKDDAGNEQLRPVTFGDCSVLLAARSQMYVYEFTFQSYNIPYIVVGGRQFYQKQEILDVLNVLKLIQNPDDDVALLAFLRSPFVQLKDTTLFWLTRGNSLRQAFFQLEHKPEHVEDTQWGKLLQARHWVKQWLQQKQFENVYDLLKAIVHETGYLYMLIGGTQGKQRAANVEKMMAIAEQIVDEKGFHLYDFIQYVKQLQEADVNEEEASIIDSRGDAVVIMSVHASKGLEFPVVCVPELRKDVLKKGGAARLLYQPGLGVGLKLNDIEKGMPGNGLFELLQEEEKDRELQEAKRLLYVALTRARDHLVLIGSKPRGKHSWLQWILKHIGFEDFESLTETEGVNEAEWSMSIITENSLPVYKQLTDETSETLWKNWLRTIKNIEAHNMEPNDLDKQRIVQLEGHQDDIHDELSQVEDRIFETNYPLMSPISQQVNELPILSATALKAYENCQRSFYLRYIKGLYGIEHMLKREQADQWSTYVREENDLVSVSETSEALSGAFNGAFSEQVEPSLMSATEKGTLVHEIIEHLGHDLMLKQTDFERKQRLAEWLKAHDCVLREGLLNESNEQALIDNLNQYIHHYVRFFESRPTDGTFEYEYPLTMLWHDQQLTGLIDCLHFHPEGDVSIIDFKTNRMTTNVQKMAEPYHLQGYLYTLICERVLKMNVRQMIFVFLETGDTYELPLNQSSLNKMEHYLSEMIVDIKNKREESQFESCSNSHCLCHII